MINIFSKKIIVVITTIIATISVIYTFNYGKNYIINQNKNEAYNKAIASIDNKKISRIPDYFYASGGCNSLIHKYYPDWAPTKTWTIKCTKIIKNEKNLLGITYKSNHTIYIKDNMNNSDTMRVVVHEWGHALISDYNIRNQKVWNTWVNYVNSLKNHKNNYYGLPEEVLVENVARCTEGYEYLNSLFNIVSCSTIKELFPVFTTVDPSVSINTGIMNNN